MIRRLLPTNHSVDRIKLMRWAGHVALMGEEK
jgi:hypothetical protein